MRFDFLLFASLWTILVAYFASSLHNLGPHLLVNHAALLHMFFLLKLDHKLLNVLVVVTVVLNELFLVFCLRLSLNFKNLVERFFQHKDVFDKHLLEL